MQITRSGPIGKVGNGSGIGVAFPPGGFAPQPSAAGTGRRMFICDPICVLPFGHNPPAMRYFRTFFAPAFDRIECCVGLPFDTQAAAAFGFRRFFSYLYDDVMPLDHRADPEEAVAAADEAPWPNDAASRVAKQDYLKLMMQEALGRRDMVFLPSADFHSVNGVLAALRELPAATAPGVLLRLIGVMENANHVVIEPLKQLCGAIAAARQAGYRIQVAAETPAYAHDLAARLDIEVAMLPYPLLADAISLPKSGPFVVVSAGSARFDKGYLDLLAIVCATRRLDKDIAIEFRIQGLTDRQIARHQAYTNQLYAAPGLVLLPSILSHEEMHALYADCHAVLLPYEREIYQMRGSAVLMEAVAYGRYAIARTGLGFSSQIAYYNNGALCSTAEDFANAIVEAAALPRDVLHRQLTMARSRYQNDTANAYHVWMEACDA